MNSFVLTLCAGGLLACVPPAAALAADPPREVSFATADSGEVFADLYGQGGRAVVLAHGAAFDKSSWSALAETLVADGFRVLAIDFRGYGKSRGGKKERGLDEDVLAAVRYLRGQRVRTVSVVGASMGGGASALAATEARKGEIDRLVLLSPVAIEHPERLRARAVLFLASRDERMAARIKDQYERAPQPKQLVLLDGSAHAQNIFGTDQGARLTGIIVRMLGKGLPLDAE